MTHEELFSLADKVGLGFIRHASDKDIEKFEGLVKLVEQRERKKYEDIITSMAKLLEMQQKRESVAVDMIEAAVLAEREACANACEWAKTNDYEGAMVCAKAIRARGQA